MKRSKIKIKAKPLFTYHPSTSVKLFDETDPTTTALTTTVSGIMGLRR